MFRYQPKTSFHAKVCLALFFRKRLQKVYDRRSSSEDISEWQTNYYNMLGNEKNNYPLGRTMTIPRGNVQYKSTYSPLGNRHRVAKGGSSHQKSLSFNEEMNVTIGDGKYLR